MHQSIREITTIRYKIVKLISKQSNFKQSISKQISVLKILFGSMLISNIFCV